MELYGGFFCTDQDVVVMASVTPRRQQAGCVIHISGQMDGATVRIEAELHEGSVHVGKLHARRLMNRIEWDSR